MRKIILSVLVLVISVGIAAAQDATPFRPRDYVVSYANDGYGFAADGSTFTLEFTVTNRGGDAAESSDVNIIASDNRILASETLDPVAAGASQTIKLEFTTTDFAGGTTQVFSVEVGIDLYELAGTDIARDNAIEISVPIPEGAIPPPIEDGGTGDPVAVDAPLLAFPGDGTIIFYGTVYPPERVFLGLGLFVAALVVLWLVSIVLRLIFRRSPKFGIWQPPYATMPTMDPGSIVGRRQGWQAYAQNGTILAAPTEGNLHCIKLLLSSDGTYMQSWRVTGIRLSQYDSYGRVGRSETIAPGWLVKRLNKVLTQNARFDNDTLAKRIRPITRALLKQFRRAVKQRSTHLPVALDIRFEGKQGDVSIAFELYQCQKFAWHRLDRWEPMMTMLGSKLLENYTYTIHGQSGGESTREFYNRLPEDVEWLLCETIRSRGIPPQEVPVPSQFAIPDTLSGMQPITEGQGRVV
jgi:hypothetical protein